MISQSIGLLKSKACIRKTLVTSYEVKGCFRSQNRLNSQFFSHGTEPDSRARLSKLWVPTGGLAVSTEEDSHTKLVRAGFLRQAHSGLFHMLPLGCRVQQKLETLIDKHMAQLGASKLSLSSISSEELWLKSGRLNKASSELFRFKDRKSASYLLSPTHEEEITTLVSSTVKSYKELPVRVYQITRKYRDELRPRQGLFRSREFVMKDLYTFDGSQSSALSTYHAVRAAYARLFDELKISYLEAEADSGDIGGTLSHEFHFPTSRGEDHILTCCHCDYVANEEVVETVLSDRPNPISNPANKLSSVTSTRVWRGISKDRSTLINVWYETAINNDANSGPAEVSFHAIKIAFPGFDSTVEDALSLISSNSDSAARNCTKVTTTSIRRLVNLVDFRVPVSILNSITGNDPELPIFPPSLAKHRISADIENIFEDPSTKRALNLLRFKDGDKCPRCVTGSLSVYKTIELGHTFHLGTRYSEPLMASLPVPVDVIEREGMVVVEDSESRSKSTQTRKVLMQMGCHGIGVSRMIGAVADTLADEKGLNWPRAIAPYEAVIISSKGLDVGAEYVYDQLTLAENTEPTSKIDLVLDDRKQSFPWKMQDADLIGYPIIIVVGRRWQLEKVCQVQCRRLESITEVHIKDLKEFVISMLELL